MREVAFRFVFVFSFSFVECHLRFPLGASPNPLCPSKQEEWLENYQSIRQRKHVPSPSNAFGVGHLINHPPPFASPNVMPLAVDFPSEIFGSTEFPSDLIENLPHTLDSPPSILQGTYIPAVAMPSVVLISTKPLKDEELFVDYRLAPSLERPEWYHPVDASEEERRWGPSM